MSFVGKSKSVTKSAQSPFFSKEAWLYRLPTGLLALSWTAWCGLMVDYLKKWSLMPNWIWLAMGVAVIVFMYNQVVPVAYGFTPNLCKLIYAGIDKKHKSKEWLAIEYTVRTVAFLVLVTVIISTIVTPFSLGYYRYLNYLYVRPVVTWGQYATEQCVVYYLPIPIVPPQCLWATMGTHFFLEKTPLRDLQMIQEGLWEGWGLKQVFKVYLNNFGFLPGF